jgi:hypothetical protein
MHLEGGSLFVHRIPEYASAESYGPVRRHPEVEHGEVQMELLWPPIWPFRRRVPIDSLQCELQGHVLNVHFRPIRIGHDAPAQKFTVEQRQGRRVRAVQHHGSQRDR